MVRSECGTTDGKRPLEHRARVCVVARLAERECQVAQGVGNVGVFCSERRLANRQRSLQQGSRTGRIAPRQADRSQCVQRRRDTWMRIAHRRLDNRERARGRCVGVVETRFEPCDIGHRVERIGQRRMHRAESLLFDLQRTIQQWARARRLP